VKKIIVINGPNLNFLGIREKSHYGNEDYNFLINMIKEHGVKNNITIDTFQSNSEGAIIDKLQQCYFDKIDGIVINPGAYTHYSYAIRDAIASISIPTVEVHISNIHEREEFRKISVIRPVCIHQIYGKGLQGYVEGIDYLLDKIK
jgi:3-dehydroquinate dehydratase-2